MVSELESPTHELTAEYGPDVLVFQRLSFPNKLVLNILINDVMDTTFDIAMPTTSALSQNLQDEMALATDPVLIIGDALNTKLKVFASQIGKVILQLPHPQDVILTMGSRWFGKGGEVQDGDFDKLVFILEQVKKLINM